MDPGVKYVFLGSRTKSPLGQNPPRQNPPGQNPPIIFYIQYPLATQILNIF